MSLKFKPEDFLYSQGPLASARAAQMVFDAWLESERLSKRAYEYAWRESNKDRVALYKAKHAAKKKAQYIPKSKKAVKSKAEKLAQRRKSYLMKKGEAA